MSFALEDLKRLLAPTALTVGTVMSIDGSRIRVATPEGALSVHSVDSVAIGDRVLIQSGVARKAPSARQSFPV